MLVFGFDPSLTGFGWCIHDGGCVGPKRVVAKGQFKTSAKTLVVQRYIDIRESVCELFTEYPEIGAVGAESTPFGESFSEGLYGLYLYVLEACLRHKKDVVYFDPMRVKLLARMDSSVRKGTMDKTDMVSIAKQDSQVKVWNHNEADAYIIARSAARFWALYHQQIGPEDLTPSETQVFLGTKKSGVLFKEGDRFYRFSQDKVDHAP